MQSIAGVDVSRETIEKLNVYSELIIKWTKSINLIAPATVSDIWERHIVDSIQVFQHAGKNWTDWVDIGSGGGLPGLVIAILSSEDQQVSLIESDTRKCLFLNTVRRELGLNVTVINERIENTNAPLADIMSARALASLTDLLQFSRRCLKPTGKALFLKGSRYQEELDEAQENWFFNATAHQSHTNSEARVLELSRISRRES